MTSEKQLPFERNTVKEMKDKAQNIEEHSEEVGLHARTNSTENDKESTTLRSSEWIKARTMGHKKQNKEEEQRKDRNKLTKLDLQKRGEVDKCKVTEHGHPLE